MLLSSPHNATPGCLTEENDEKLQRSEYNPQQFWGGNSYSVSGVLETAGRKSERDEIAVFLWPVSLASGQDCRLGLFLWSLLLVSLCKCHGAVIRRRSERCSNYTCSTMR